MSKSSPELINKYKFIKYFPKTEHVVFNLDDKYVNVENIKERELLLEKDDDLLTIKNHDEWYELLIKKSSFDDMDKLRKLLLVSDLPEISTELIDHILCVICHGKSTAIHWHGDKENKKKYENFVNKYLSLS